VRRVCNTTGFSSGGSATGAASTRVTSVERNTTTSSGFVTTTSESSGVFSGVGNATSSFVEASATGS